MQNEQASNDGASINVTRLLKKKIKSDGSVDRDGEREGEEKSDEEETIFKDCIQNENKFTKILEFMEEVRGEISNIKEKLDSVVNSVKNEIKAEITVIDKKVESVLERLDNYDTKILEIKTQLSRQEKISQNTSADLCDFNSFLERCEDKLIDLESRSRRNNIIFMECLKWMERIV